MKTISIESIEFSIKSGHHLNHQSWTLVIAPKLWWMLVFKKKSPKSFFSHTFMSKKVFRRKVPFIEKWKIKGLSKKQQQPKSIIIIKNTTKPICLYNMQMWKIIKAKNQSGQFNLKKLEIDTN